MPRHFLEQAADSAATNDGLSLTLPNLNRIVRSKLGESLSPNSHDSDHI